MCLLSCLFQLFVSSVLTVSLQSVSPVTEGGDATVCVAAAFPAGGSDCNVTITLNVTDGTATGVSMSLQRIVRCMEVAMLVTPQIDLKWLVSNVRCVSIG